MPAVFLVKPGSIKRDEQGRILDARSSVALIYSKEQMIIVDSGTKGEGELIRRELQRIGVEPEEINILINTHSHADHCGNNCLFSHAKNLAGKDGDIIAPGVRVMATPGHSMDSISIMVEMNNAASQIKTIVIAGDALPTFGNFLKNVPPSLHVDRELAIASMRKIVSLSDIVVPGHDIAFSVRRREYMSIPFMV
ncbi:MAG: Hydroxyacylglutathione hydrolase [Methanosaeta sp. PtaU1.Bin112]|nr:MAG: Hydroxyacylglutathione hydrolase [Methanosaeta sp. PtaU1.Bin112]